MTIHFQFQDLCDNNEKKLSLFELLNGTDETDCDGIWCLINPSTQCDGHWDCSNGLDELNCSSELSVGQTKSSVALRKLYGCSMLEHFCLPVFNSSEVMQRPCLEVSRAGDGHIDCLGSTDERFGLCTDISSTWISVSQYRCIGLANICIDLQRVCDGHADCPLRDDENVCEWLPTTVKPFLFYCRNGTIIRRANQCNARIDCTDGEDEWFCDLKSHTSIVMIIPRFDEYQYPVYPGGLQKMFIQDRRHIRSTPWRSSSPMRPNWYCNRGISINDRRQLRCLCPPSYMGPRCETQRERVSVFLQVISSTLLQPEFGIKLIVYLINIVSLQVLVEEEILHLPYVHSQYKHLITLASIHANNAFVRIDAYEVSAQSIMSYRTSWKFNLPFSFLPVRRLPVRLVLPKGENTGSRIRSNCQSCVHGTCLAYQNSDDVFCQCHNGWVDQTCNTSFICASGGQTLSSHRCLCPMDRHGTRCFVPNSVKCRCQNGGVCIPLDARVEQSACLCANQYFGKYCERLHASLTINFISLHDLELLPVFLVQFVTVLKESSLGSPYETMNFENIFLYERLFTHHALTVHHVGHEELPLMVLCKIFYSSSVDHYAYYLLSYMPSNEDERQIYSKNVVTQLEAKQKCPHVREMNVFKTPVNILAYPHIKRSKFYVRGCTDRDIRRFHDEVYLCFCPDKEVRIPSCTTFDHTREACQAPSFCLNGGLCIENRRKNMVQFSCLCQECHYYGSLCQFSIGHQGLSLDTLIGLEMRTGKSFVEQSVSIKLSMTAVLCMVIIGFVGNTLSTITFSRKKPLQTGCGWYLLLMSVSNQAVLIVFGLRFVYFLVTQTTVWNNRAQSLLLCQCLEVGLIFLRNLSNWLSACVSTERTLTVARGAAFDKMASVRSAKRLCIILSLGLMAMIIHEPMTRQLIEDPRLGQYTWCVTKFNSTTIKTVATIFSIFHLLGPFLINLIATGALIFIISRQRFTVRKDTTRKAFLVVLHEQIAHYKQLIISPVVLLLLALPHLIISLGSLCISTSWRNYVFLAAYFVSYAPLVSTILIFVLPAPIYRKELKLCLLQFRCFFICQLSRSKFHKPKDTTVK
jgi:hypothetical protein